MMGCLRGNIIINTSSDMWTTSWWIFVEKNRGCRPLEIYNNSRKIIKRVLNMAQSTYIFDHRYTGIDNHNMMLIYFVIFMVTII